MYVFVVSCAAVCISVFRTIFLRMESYSPRMVVQTPRMACAPTALRTNCPYPGERCPAWRQNPPHVVIFPFAWRTNPPHCGLNIPYPVRDETTIFFFFHFFFFYQQCFSSFFFQFMIALLCCHCCHLLLLLLLLLMCGFFVVRCLFRLCPVWDKSDISINMGIVLGYLVAFVIDATVSGASKSVASAGLPFPFFDTDIDVRSSSTC